MNLSYPPGGVNAFKRLLWALCLAPTALVALASASSQPVSFIAPLDVEAGDQVSSIAVADFNRDGIPDLAVVISTAPPAGSGGVAIMLGRGDGTFGPPEIVFRTLPDASTFSSSASSSGSLAVGDFNGDGNPDLAVVNHVPFSGSGGVTILLGNGDGSFRPPLDFSAGTSSPSRAVAAGDLDGDGLPDLVVTNLGPSNSISVLLGNGDGTFQPAMVFDLGVSPKPPWSVAVADFNGDGHADVVVGIGGASFVCVLLGNGDGSLQPPVRYEAGFEAVEVVASDFNGDGHPDIAVAFEGLQFPPIAGGVSVLLGNGDGTFQPAVNYAAGIRPIGIAAGDFNHDGFVDLVVANYQSQDASVLLGNGDGTFQPALNLDAGSLDTLSGIAAADFNGDGIADFAVADFGGAAVAIMLSSGDGSFHARPSLLRETPTWAAAAGDLNGDGIDDLVVTKNLVPGAVQVLLSQGDGSFGPPITTPLPDCAAECGPVALALADFNGDGNLDASVVDVNVGVVILLGNGDGTLRQRSVIPLGHLGTSTGSIAVGDFNNDQIPDLAIAIQGTNTVLVALGNGDGTFQPGLNFLVGQSPQSVAVADFNGDGFQDLVVTNLASNSISVLLGHGDGTFDPAVNYATPRRPLSVAVADFNSDGIPDLAVTQGPNGSDRHNQAWVLLGKGDGTFQPAVAFQAGVFTPHKIIAADFDGDGKQDLAVADSANSITVLPGNGDGTFRPAISFVTGNSPNSMAVGDFNGDGKPDLVTANIPTDVGGYSISVLINDTQHLVRLPGSGRRKSPLVNRNHEFLPDLRSTIPADEYGFRLDSTSYQKLPDLQVPGREIVLQFRD